MGMLSTECRTTLVHPHGRGDNERFGVVWSRVDGSPPRAWGQFNAARSSQSKPRFTPTGVGTMLDRSKYAFPHLVHPHGRGDNECSWIVRHAIDGSPPRAWGQSQRSRRLRIHTRFTPTGVGTMYPPRCHNILFSVHPHGRGDNAVMHVRMHQMHGSPPRAWGQSRPGGSIPSILRFTPTGVGTMQRNSRISARMAVHPHGRGDNVGETWYPGGYHGSPPRAWGQCLTAVMCRGMARFTPTGVGTMLVARSRDACPAVHPHGRGDNTMPKASRDERYGSPPRAWGQ